jgi:hypothetical protein
MWYSTSRIEGEPMEWEVWLADGTTRNSRAHRWEDVPDGILVLRWWGPHGKGINWSDGLYGHPATHKQAGFVSDEEFSRAMEAAKASTSPPSQRA